MPAATVEVDLQHIFHRIVQLDLPFVHQAQRARLDGEQSRWTRRENARCGDDQLVCRKQEEQRIGGHLEHRQSVVLF